MPPGPPQQRQRQRQRQQVKPPGSPPRQGGSWAPPARIRRLSTRAPCSEHPASMPPRGQQGRQELALASLRKTRQPRMLPRGQPPTSLPSEPVKRSGAPAQPLTGQSVEILKDPRKRTATVVLPQPRLQQRLRRRRGWRSCLRRPWARRGTAAASTRSSASGMRCGRRCCGARGAPLQGRPLQGRPSSRRIPARCTRAAATGSAPPPSRTKATGACRGRPRLPLGLGHRMTDPRGQIQQSQVGCCLLRAMDLQMEAWAEV